MAKLEIPVRQVVKIKIMKKINNIVGFQQKFFLKYFSYNWKWEHTLSNAIQKKWWSQTQHYEIRSVNEMVLLNIRIKIQKQAL